MPSDLLSIMIKTLTFLYILHMRAMSTVLLLLTATMGQKWLSVYIEAKQFHKTGTH